MIFTAVSQVKKDSVKSEVPFEWKFSKYRFGCYSEILYQQMNYGLDRYKYTDGAPSDKRAYISVPRAVFSFDYKLRDDLVIGSEVEIEYGDIAIRLF